MADQPNFDITPSPYGIATAARLASAFRMLTFAVSAVAALFTLLKRGEWNEVAQFFQTNQGIGLCTIIGGAAVFIWSQVHSGRIKTRVEAFRAALEALGLNSFAIDPTVKKVENIPLAPDVLVPAVVSQHPTIAANAIASVDTGVPRPDRSPQE